MTRTDSNERLARELLAMLAGSFADMVVEVSPSERWKRMCVTFRWPGFAELLPEERFHRLAAVVPESYRQTQLGGFVWLELAPGESLDAFLALPRSEDVASREASVYAALVRAGFFPALGKALGPSPEKSCARGFEKTASVLERKKFAPAGIRDAKLIFIRHGSYCDCQALLVAQPALAQQHAGAA
ncbi:MAG: hypothetical protein HY763_15295 [Planctomycetes bacterium]|nr:hypothetical protein [Planctomycetota bacterium]